MQDLSIPYGCSMFKYVTAWELLYVEKWLRWYQNLNSFLFGTKACRPSSNWMQMFEEAIVFSFFNYWFVIHECCYWNHYFFTIFWYTWLRNLFYRAQLQLHRIISSVYRNSKNTQQMQSPPFEIHSDGVLINCNCKRYQLTYPSKSKIKSTFTFRKPYAHISHLTIEKGRLMNINLGLMSTDNLAYLKGFSILCFPLIYRYYMWCISFQKDRHCTDRQHIHQVHVNVPTLARGKSCVSLMGNM